MEIILNKELTIINNYHDLETVLELYNIFYDRETFNKLYSETIGELKLINKDNDLNLVHEILHKKQLNYYNYLGLNNVKLKDNESEFWDQMEILEDYDYYTSNFNYYPEITDLTSYGFYLPYLLKNNFKINITGEYHIIIDFIKKEVYNLTEDSLEIIITNLILDYELLEDNDFKLYMLNGDQSPYNEILINDKENRDIYNLNIDNCIKYCSNDKFIKIDYLTNKWRTINELIIDLETIKEEILYGDNYIIEYLEQNY